MPSPNRRALSGFAMAMLCLVAPIAGEAAPAGGFAVEYTGYSHGFMVMKLAGTLSLTRNSYTAHVTFHTAGLAGMIVHADNDSRVSGSFGSGVAQPAWFEGFGHLHGTERRTRMIYKNANPVVLELSPPAEQERSAISPGSTAYTIDTLSAVAVLIRQVAYEGKCEGSVTTFDGRRLAEQTVHLTGQEVLPKSSWSIFAGKALRCDFEGRQLGGFIRTENEDDLRKPRHGTAWIAEMLPDVPPVPVRVSFENKLLGQVTLYLTAIRAAK